MSNVLEYYKYLHTIPELGFEEIKTSAFLADKLEEFGYEVTCNVGGSTGVVGVLRSGVTGPVVAIRADMDALGHVIDGTFCARHTCGHDGHSSVVLSVAERISKENLLKKGTLKIIFQPAEELGTGAQTIVDGGVIDDVEYIIGSHVRPAEEVADGQATPALFYAASGTIVADIYGKPAHGARPHLGINAIDAATLAISAVNTIHLKPTESYSAKATRFLCDSGVTNAIPSHATVTWDIRAQRNEIMEELREKFFVAVNNAVASVGATVTFDATKRLTAAVLDDSMTELLAEAITEVLGEKGLVPPVVTPGGEDFFVYTNHKPSLKAGFFGLGCGLQPGLHHPDMHFHIESLENSVNIFVAALKKLVG